jgi:hypothetical protein
LSSSPFLATSRSATRAQPRSPFALSTRKPAVESPTRLATKLEETLDDIAADISHGDAADEHA